MATPSDPSRNARCWAGSMRRPGKSSACSRSVGGAMRARRARIAPPSEREQALEFPGLRIDPAQHRAFLLGSEGVATDARLTRTEFRLLHQLARNAGRVLSRDELHQRVWDVPYRHRDRTVDVFVRKLREKLDRRSTFAYVHTHYGVGYRFGAEMRGSDAA